MDPGDLKLEGTRVQAGRSASLDKVGRLSCACAPTPRILVLESRDEWAGDIRFGELSGEVLAAPPFHRWDDPGTLTSIIA